MSDVISAAPNPLIHTKEFFAHLCEFHGGEEHSLEVAMQGMDIQTNRIIINRILEDFGMPGKWLLPGDITNYDDVKEADAIVETIYPKITDPDVRRAVSASRLALISHYRKLAEENGPTAQNPLRYTKQFIELCCEVQGGKEHSLEVFMQGMDIQDHIAMINSILHDFDMMGQGLPGDNTTYDDVKRVHLIVKELRSKITDQDVSMVVSASMFALIRHYRKLAEENGTTAASKQATQPQPENAAKVTAEKTVDGSIADKTASPAILFTRPSETTPPIATTPSPSATPPQSPTEVKQQSASSCCIVM